MFIILGTDQKEYGPASSGQIREWIRGGRANLETRAKISGESEWKTLGDFPEFKSDAGQNPPALAAIPAAASGEATPVPAPITLPGDARSIADDLRARAAPLDIFGCLARSFELWKANFLSLVGVTFLVMLLQLAVGAIPILGMVAGFFVNGVFYGGLYYFYLGKVRGEPRELRDAFAGFTRAFVPLMLTTLLTSTLILAIVVPFFAPWILFAFQEMIHRGGEPPVPTLTTMVVALAGMIPLIYLSVSWIFAFVLVIDKGLGPWTAMEVSRRVVGKQWFRVFLVALLGSFLAVLGLIALLVGVVFTLPLMVGALVCAYEDLCNPPSKSG